MAVSWASKLLLDELPPPGGAAPATDAATLAEGDGVLVGTAYVMVEDCTWNVPVDETAFTCTSACKASGHTI